MSVVKIEEGDSVTWGAPNNIGDVNVNPESTFKLINVTDETVVDSISTSGTVEKSYTPDLNAGEEADFKVKRIVQVDGNTTVTVESSNLVTIKVATTTQALLGQVNFDFGEPNYSITSGTL